MQRLEFARSHQTWLEQWKYVVWSDENKWNLDGPDGNSKVWHDNRRKASILMKRHNGGESLMVWGAFSYNGKSELAIISTSQDSNEYKRHLQETLLPVWNELS